MQCIGLEIAPKGAMAHLRYPAEVMKRTGL
jgi:hypothetical protein